MRGDREPPRALAGQLVGCWEQMGAWGPWPRVGVLFLRLGEPQLLHVRRLGTGGVKTCPQSLVLVVLWLVSKKDKVPAKKLCRVCL